MTLQSNGSISLFAYEADHLKKVSDVDNKYAFGSIYNDTNGVFGPLQSKYLYMMTSSGLLHLLALPSRDLIFSTDQISDIPTSIHNSNSVEESMSEDDNRVEVLDSCLVNLGKGGVKRAHLIVSHSLMCTSL